MLVEALVHRAVGRRMPQADGVADLVLDDAREEQRLRQLRHLRPGREDHEPVGDLRERRAVHDPGHATRARAADGDHATGGDVVFRILVRDEPAPGHWRHSATEERRRSHRPRPAVGERDGSASGIGPGTQRLDDLRVAVAAVEWRWRERVAVPGHGRTAVGLVPAHVAEQLVARDNGCAAFEIGRRGDIARRREPHGAAPAPSESPRRNSQGIGDASRAADDGSPPTCRTSSAPAIRATHAIDGVTHRRGRQPPRVRSTSARMSSPTMNCAAPGTWSVVSPTVPPSSRISISRSAPPA